MLTPGVLKLAAYSADYGEAEEQQATEGHGRETERGGRHDPTLGGGPRASD